VFFLHKQLNKLSTVHIVYDEGVFDMTKKTYVLEGLCCPNCAAKIDEQVKRLPGVRRASVDFPNTRLTIEFEGDENALLETIAGIARDVDEDITVKAG
jgi:Cd2+/Zn2+-exporting ATPase